jgi:hypothetical protein
LSTEIPIGNATTTTFGRNWNRSRKVSGECPRLLPIESRAAANLHE